MHPYDYIFSGLALDVVGAMVLAKGFMLKDPQAAYYEGLMIFGSNPHLLKSALLQRAEARVGAGFLIIGFLLQIWGSLHGGIAASEPGWINSTWRVLGVLAAAAGLAWLLLCIMLQRARAQLYHIFFRKYSQEEKLNPVANDPSWFDRFAKLLDVRRRWGESDADLLIRLEKQRVRLGTRHGGQNKTFLVNR